MKKEAFVYGWRNIKDGKMYIGYRGSEDVNDGYVFSSEDMELKSAWSMGLLRRSIIYRGTKSKCITMERKLLKYADARRSDMFYNKSNGGGAGIEDYRTISDEEAKVGIDWINGIDPVMRKAPTYVVVDKKLVKEIWDRVQKREFEVKEVPTEEIMKFGQNQVRLNMIDPSHVQAIAERMKHDPAEARKHINPIIVCVYEDGSFVIIDGNHTSRSIVEAGWVSAPVMFINSSEFLDHQSNIDNFGIIANHNPQIKKPNSPQDCQRAITNIYVNNLESEDKDFKILKGTKFKNTVTDILYPEWTKSQISGNLNSAIARLETERAQADMNFVLYSKPKLDAIVKKVREENPNLAVVTVTSGTVHYAGSGAVLHKMSSMGVTEGLIVCHHSGLSDYNKWSNSESSLKGVMTLMNQIPNAKVKYILLDPFKLEDNINDRL